MRITVSVTDMHKNLKMWPRCLGQQKHPLNLLGIFKMTVFILEQVLAGSMLEGSKYQVLEAQFRRWFHNFPTPFRDRTGTLSVTASNSSYALPRLGSIRSIRKSSYFTFLTSNLDHFYSQTLLHTFFRAHHHILQMT